MTRQERRQRVLDVVTRNEVHSQEEIIALLEAEGVSIVQATLSRDLRELGIRKGPAGYRPQEAPRRQRRRQRSLGAELRRRILGASRGGTMVVLRTSPGEASALARQIDEAGLHEVLGTVAGHDTVFVAAGTIAQAKAIEQLLAPKS